MRKTRQVGPGYSNQLFQAAPSGRPEPPPSCATVGSLRLQRWTASPGVAAAHGGNCEYSLRLQAGLLVSPKYRMDTGVLASILGHWLASPAGLLLTAFQIWMLVDAVRQKEWIWVLFLIVFPGFSAFWYYFMVYRTSPSATRGFERPGAHDRRRIRELQAQIHHLDKAHHYSQLGDIYFQRGKLEQAESCYRSAMERDPQDIDTRAHFGQCLLRQNRAQEAKPLLEGVVAENPKHDYGYSLMGLAEAQAAVGATDAAIATWE